MRKAVRFAVAAGIIVTLGLLPLAASVSNFSVTPATITFTSSNPNGSVTGSPVTTTVSFKTTANPSSFHVYAKATGPNFTSCTTGNAPAVSAVTLTCSGASGVTCQSGSLTLTNTGSGTNVAFGSGNHNPASFTATYTFQDAWKYGVGTSCTLSVQWIYTEP